MLRVGLLLLAFGAFGYLFYKWTMRAATEWGYLVKGAFDLYRWDLLKKLGYKQEPKTRKEERNLWGKITQQTIYGDKKERDGDLTPRPDYVETPSPTPGATAVTCPEGLKVSITRGIKPKRDKRQVTIVIRVKNEDDHAAKDLVVTDTLPDQLRYKWASAKVHGHNVRVVGINPYEFHIDGSLPGQDEVVLSYLAVEYP